MGWHTYHRTTVLHISLHLLPDPVTGIGHKSYALLRFILIYRPAKPYIPLLFQVLDVLKCLVILCHQCNKSPVLLPEPQHIVWNVHACLDSCHKLLVCHVFLFHVRHLRI